MIEVVERLSKGLEHVKVLAKTNAFGRLKASPFRYLWGQVFNNFIYPVTKRQRVVPASTFFGEEMKVALPAGSDIYFTQGKSHDSEIRLAQFLIKEVGKESHFLDIGAHFGYFSLLASKLTGLSGMVFSFEPGKLTFDILRQNTIKHTGIKAFNSAVSARKGKLHFYEFPISFSEYNTLDVSQFADEAWFEKYKPQKIEVEADTIDNITSDGTFRPDIIKIDVEGAEDQVILGGQHYLQSHSPVVIMEYLSVRRNNESHKKAVHNLLSLGYAPAIIIPDGSVGKIQVDDLDAYLDKNGLESDNIVFRKL